MKNAIILLLSILFFANLAVSDDKERQRKFAQLMLERSRLQQELTQQASTSSIASIQERIKEIDDEIDDMGIGMPNSPEPPLSEMDRTDLQMARPPALMLDYRTCSLSINITPSYNNNYFQAVAGTPRQPVLLTDVSTSFSFPLAQDYKQHLWASVSAQRTFVRGIENGDWNVYGVRLNYEYKNHQLTFHGFLSPRKLTFVSNDGRAGLAQTKGFGADYRTRPNRNTRLRLFYRWNDVRYPGFEDRDSEIHFASGDIQYRFHDLFMPGIGFEYANNLAISDNYRYREMTPVFLLSSRLGRVASVNLRYRFKQREYSIEDSLLSNFGRKDRRHDVYMYTGIGLGRSLYLTLFGGYTQSISSRQNRSFNAFSAGATLQFQFPSQ